MNAIDDAKAYDKKTAAFIGFLVQNIPEISDESMNFWIENPKDVKKVLSGLNLKSQEIKQPIQFRNVDVVTTHLLSIPGKKTRLCFTDPLYSYRASGINYVLPENQLRTEGCFIQVLTPHKRVTVTFAELAVALLDVPIDTPIKTLGSLLKVRDHTVTLPQIENMVEITERNLETGMNSGGADNFFFLENRKSKISVGCLSRGKSSWAVGIYGFENESRYAGNCRLLVRN